MLFRFLVCDRFEHENEYETGGALDWYTATLPRRFTSHFTVVRVGRFPRKNGWVDNRFDTVNFSFIMSGAGEYRLHGRTWPVTAPCVITQWPLQDFHYGPFEVWDELFICFAPEHQEAIVERGLLDTHRPVWYLEDPGPVLASLEKLTDLSEGPDQRCVGDRVDLMAETIVMESLIRTTRPALSREERLVHEAAKLMNRRMAESFDFDSFAAKHNVHPATLRRQWMRTFERPPLQYHMDLRIQRACQLLCETELSVKEVGAQVGFVDQLYFSRYFKKRVKVPPRQYRERLRGGGGVAR